MAAQIESKPFSLVVAIDFGEQSEKALMTALNLARRSAPSVVHAVHVVTTMPSADMAPPALVDVERQGRARLEGLIAAMRLTDEVCCHVRVGSAADALSDLAMELHADVLVLGTHSRRGVSRLLFGSVAEAVVRRAPCSVLVVRERVLSPEENIEPPCGDCVARANESGDVAARCARHASHHPRAHTYHETTSPKDFGMGAISLRTPGS